MVATDPLAYPLAGHYYFNYLWFPFFACWLIKRIILKYGGLRAYRDALPLFLGLFLGDFVLGSVWAIIGLLTGKTTYMFQELVMHPPGAQKSFIISRWIENSVV